MNAPSSPLSGSQRDRETWAEIQRRLFEECETAGWDPDKRNSFAEECAHLHEEVSEAFREWRIKHRWNLRRDYQAEGRTLHPVGASLDGSS